MGVEVIKVDKKGPYGPMCGNVWYGISKKANITIDEMVEGQSYTVEIWTSDKGKKYINKVMSSSQATQPSAGEPSGRGAPPPSGNASNNTELQERIARNTAYQKATDAVSRNLTPFLSKEEDIVPKLQSMIEPLAEWLYSKIKGS